MSRLLMHRRKLWVLRCESLFQILAASFTPNQLEELGRKRGLTGPPGRPQAADWFQWAHERCHHDSPFTREVQRQLNQKHVVSLTRLAGQSAEHLQRLVDRLLGDDGLALPPDTAGLLWALCSDPRTEIRPIEASLVNGLHHLSHCLLVAHFRGDVRLRTPATPTHAAQLEALQQKIAELTAARQALQTSYRRLEQRQQRLAQENQRLEQRLQHLVRQRVPRLSPPDPQPAALPSASRELKKLRYQVARLTRLVTEKDRRIQELNAWLHAKAPDSEPAVATPRSSAPDFKTPSGLRGKKVALIGGLGRATPHYTQAIQALGGACLYHHGGTRQGDKRLADVIRQADVVFCPVDRTSHGAASFAKKLCKALQKPCYFLRSSGVSQVRDKILEIAHEVGG